MNDVLLNSSKYLNENFYNDDLIVTRKGFVSLQGFPEKVNGDFFCYGNKLTTLEHSPEIVQGNFNCSINYGLTSLKGRPKEIKKSFICERVVGGLETKEDLKKEVIKNQIKARNYHFGTDINFFFEDIEKEFTIYKEKLEKDKQLKQKKLDRLEQTKQTKKSFNKDFGYGF